MNPNKEWDHSVYVPLMLMVPDASIPIVSISVLKDESAWKHIAIGEALAPLRKKGVMILGSGASFWNMNYLMAGGKNRDIGI
jgi:4,5-DOPA dioxygenase extradiol